MIATFLAGVASALVVLGWAAYSVPWLALGVAFVPVLVGAWILGEAREGTRIGTSHVVAGCATYVLVGAAALLADPFCSSLLGEGVLLDARVPMMALLLLLAPRPGVLGAIVATVGARPPRWGAGVECTMAAVWSEHRHGRCVRGGWPRRRLALRGAHRPVSEQLAGARDQAVSAQVRIGDASCRIRAEEELWVADTLASAQELLDDIATGTSGSGRPTDAIGVRSQAEFLRALLAVGQAPMSVRRPARIWLAAAARAPCRDQGCAARSGAAEVPRARRSARSAG